MIKRLAIMASRYFFAVHSTNNYYLFSILYYLLSHLFSWEGVETLPYIFMGASHSGRETRPLQLFIVHYIHKNGSGVILSRLFVLFTQSEQLEQLEYSFPRARHCYICPYLYQQERAYR